MNNNLPISSDGRWIVPHEGFERLAPPQVAAPRDSGGIDFNRLMQAFAHWRWLILGCVAAGIVLGVLAAMLTTPMYRATVTLEVNPLTVEVVDEKSRPQAASAGSGDLVATQIGLLSSRATAQRAAEELNLANNATVVGTKGSTTDRLRRATDVVADGLRVKPPLSGTLIEYSYSSSSPELAAAIANQIGHSFINGGLQRRYDASSYARAFLSQQIAKSRADLEQSERQLVAYAQAQGIINTAGPEEKGQATGDVNSLQGESLVELNRALGAATARRVSAEGTYRQGIAVGATSDVTNSTAGLRAARATLQAEYQEKRTLMKPEHPDMISLQTRIAEIDRQITREASQVSASRSNSLLADYRAAAAAERALASRVAGLKGSVLNLRGRSIQYNILQRETDTNRSLYDALLQRYKEVGVAAGIGSSPVSIVDSADVPRGPYSPNLSYNILAGLLIGLVGGLGGAVALDFLYDTIKTREEVRAKLGLACLGAIPKISAKGEFIDNLKDPRSVVGEAYGSVIAALRFSTDDGLPRRMMVTSAQAREGKSSSALALAQNLSRLGNRVLLIDADLRKPVFRSANPNVGLTHLLTGEGSDLIDHVQPTQFDKLFLLPAGPIPPNPADLLSSARMQSMLQQLEGEYDVLIVDGPPVAGLADALLLASIVNNVLFVVEAGRTRTKAAVEALGTVRSTGAHVLGAILTKAKDLGGYRYYDYRARDSIEQESQREILMFPNNDEADA